MTDLEWSINRIIDGVNEGSIEHDGWGYCKGCESEYPYQNNKCLVCGQEINNGERNVH